MITDRKALKILDILTESGHEAYFVGGCVRDSTMGRSFHDTDITTDALPDEIIEIFHDFKTLLTGIKHGTVTVICEGTPFEITTFRIDGEYKDSRRPDSVKFTRSLEKDLSRRDFTINAMAMDFKGDITDLFGGKKDIEDKLIRCVGNPEKRFEEDALRIMRALRFSAQLGFEIETETSVAIRKMKNRLKNISNERIREELDKLICGKYCTDVLMNYGDVITTIIPEFEKCIGFEQHSPYHKYTVWEHSVRALSHAPCDNPKMRRALLFHDIAKPLCAEFDDSGRGHFKKHAEKGAEMTKNIMKRLRYDGNSISYAVMTIAHHSDRISNKADIKKLMSTVGDRLFFEVMEIKKCDNSAKNDFVLEENQIIDDMIETGHGIIENDECRGLRNLAVNGNDFVKNGLHGAEVGKALNELLLLVIEEKLENDREKLLDYIKQRCIK